MKWISKGFFIMLLVLIALSMTVYGPSTVMAAKAPKESKAADPMAKANGAFDYKKMSDMSDFNPGTWVAPTGDTIKIAVVASFSGPAVVVGNVLWTGVTWAAHDINKRGGIMVDGKKKLIQVMKADTMGKVDQAKKICERMVLQEKVHVLCGSDGSQIVKVMNEVATKYKVIAMNNGSSSDDIMAAESFGRYAFHSNISSDQIARGLAYYYGQIRKKEKKFYILCQDYGFGHLFAEGFRNGLKMYFPEAQVVGEDFHKLFLTDFAPYLTKIKSSGAEVILTGDWDPDSLNLAKQSRAMGVNLPFANIWIYNPNTLLEVGIEGGKGWVHVGPYHSPVPFSAVPGYTELAKSWHNQWSKWKDLPFNNRSFEHYYAGVTGNILMQSYWLLNVIERAKTTNADKIIQVWEGDTYRMANGKIIKMRVCDHKAIQDLSAEEFATPEGQKVSFTIPPYYWFKDSSYTGKITSLPAAKVLPWMDQKLDRCKGKSDWGE